MSLGPHSLAHLLIVVLNLSQPVDAVVWVGNVVLVDLRVAARGAKYEIDKLGHRFGFVLVESDNPLRRNVLEPGSVRIDLSCIMISCNFKDPSRHATILPYRPSASSSTSALLRGSAFRGFAARFFAALAGRIARLTASPLGLGFFCGGFLAAVRPLLFRRCSLNSSSSGSPWLSSDCSSSSDGASLSASESFPSRLFRFALRAGLPSGANLVGFLITRPDLRRAAEDVGSAADDDMTAALMMVMRECVGQKESATAQGRAVERKGDDVVCALDVGRVEGAGLSILPRPSTASRPFPFSTSALLPFIDRVPCLY
jgi:hypothetical protein